MDAETARCQIRSDPVCERYDYERSRTEGAKVVMDVPSVAQGRVDAGVGAEEGQRPVCQHAGARLGTTSPSAPGQW